MQRITLLLLSLLFCASAPAQLAGGEFAITRSVIAAGGGRSAGGEFAITGTIGQAEAGTSSGGAFFLSGGFWAPGERDETLFQDGFEG